jgi:hypothetical protein
MSRATPGRIERAGANARGSVPRGRGRGGLGGGCERGRAGAGGPRRPPEPDLRARASPVDLSASRHRYRRHRHGRRWLGWQRRGRVCRLRRRWARIHSCRNCQQDELADPFVEQGWHAASSTAAFSPSASVASAETLAGWEGQRAPSGWARRVACLRACLRTCSTSDRRSADLTAPPAFFMLCTCRSDTEEGACAGPFGS